MDEDIVRTALLADAVLDLEGRDHVAGLHTIADLVREELLGELDEGGLPKHMAIGVNKFGHGPVDEHGPDYDRTVCWCGEPECLEYIRPPAWFAGLADWLDATADDLERRGVTARVKASEQAAITMARSYLAWHLMEAEYGQR